jgi:hypothetical protein
MPGGGKNARPPLKSTKRSGAWSRRESRGQSAREAVTASESARTLRLARHRQGLLPLTEVLDAETGLAGARALLLRSEYDARVAAAQLQFALENPSKEYDHDPFSRIGAAFALALTLGQGSQVWAEAQKVTVRLTEAASEAPRPCMPPPWRPCTGQRFPRDWRRRSRRCWWPKARV